jgi:hypothetical protein
MFFFLALILLIACVGIMFSDPFLSQPKTVNLALWAFLGAVICFGVGLGKLF